MNHKSRIIHQTSSWVRGDNFGAPWGGGIQATLSKSVDRIHCQFFSSDVGIAVWLIPRLLSGAAVTIVMLQKAIFQRIGLYVRLCCAATLAVIWDTCMCEQYIEKSLSIFTLACLPATGSIALTDYEG